MAPKFLVLADLHHDFWQEEKRDPFHGLEDRISGLDHLVIAGDLTNKPKTRWAGALARLSALISPERISVLPGNHDYYQANFDEEDRLAEIAKEAGVNFVQKGAIDLGGTRLLCATLWTDFNLGGDKAKNVEAARSIMNDYRKIRVAAGGYRKLSPADTSKAHSEHIAWLRRALETPYDGKTIVVTHHAPVPEATEPMNVAAAYASDLREFIQETGPDGWFFGHTHTHCDIRIGKTWVRNTSLGYPFEVLDPAARISSLIIDPRHDPIYQGTQEAKHRPSRPAAPHRPTLVYDAAVPAIRDQILSAPDVSELFEVAKRAKVELLAVGGCVRDVLMGQKPSDIDLCSALPPDQAAALFRDGGYEILPTGVEHGTITVMKDRGPMLPKGSAFEITTFRRDVETDGRRACVAWSDDIHEDAERRDFTINALYANADGQVLDPTGQGIEDIAARRLRFVGDPETRIREDGLRIMRYFRFLAQKGLDPNHCAPKDLAAISKNTDMLEKISRERVGKEVGLLLAASDPSRSIAMLEQAGCLDRILPGADSIARKLPALIDAERRAGIAPQMLNRLALANLPAAGEKLKLSRKQSKYLGEVIAAAQGGSKAAEIGHRQGMTVAEGAILHRLAHGEPQNSQRVDFTAARHGAAMPLPVSGRDMLSRLNGPAVGAAIERAREKWIDSGFTASQPELLAHALGAGMNAKRARKRQGQER